MCLRNVSGTVRVIKMTSANRLTASGCIASRWVYILIVNLLETPDGKFRDNMHTLTLVKFRTWDSWHSNQPCVWNADGDWHSFECGARRHFCEVIPDKNKINRLLVAFCFQNIIKWLIFLGKICNGSKGQILKQTDFSNNNWDYFLSREGAV